MNRVPIEKEFFVLKIDEVNEHGRKYSTKIVNEWIENLKNNKLGYKIEYAFNLNPKNLMTEFIKDTLNCGSVTEFKILEQNNNGKLEKILIAKAKFKIKGPYIDELYKPNFFDNITLIPKGIGKVWGNEIYDYNLIGFNLVSTELSPFIETKNKSTKSPNN